MSVGKREEQRRAARDAYNHGKPMFPQANIDSASKGKIESVKPLVGGKAVKEMTDTVERNTLIIAYIKEYAAKHQIILTTDTIIGKNGVGNPGNKKRAGYGSAGQPGLLHKALAAYYVRENGQSTGEIDLVRVTKKDGSIIRRARWKIVVEWEIKLMANRTKDRPLLRKMVRDKETGIKQPATGDGDYVGLVKIAHGDDPRMKDKTIVRQLEQYIKQIKCTMYVDCNGMHYVRIPPQWERRAVTKRIREILTGDFD